MNEESGEKKKLSVKEWILCIGGILFLTLLMVLPPTFRILFEEEASFVPSPTKEPEVTIAPSMVPEKPQTKEEIVLCTKSGETSPLYQESLEIQLIHNNLDLKKEKEIVIRTYDSTNPIQVEEWNKTLASCNPVPLYYRDIQGFDYSCESSDDTIQITKTYDLTSFVNTTTNIDQDTIEVLSTPYFLNQNVDIVRIGLENEGYYCRTYE